MKSIKVGSWIGYVTWNASASLNVVTTQSSDFVSIDESRGSYNLIKIVGLLVSSFSNLILLAIIKLLLPKLR